MEDIKPSSLAGPPPPRPPEPPADPPSPTPTPQPASDTPKEPVSNERAVPTTVTPPTETPTPKKSAPAPSDQIVIRTMQDDLGALKGVAATSRVAKVIPTPSPPADKAGKTLPLPPKQAAEKQKVVIVPALKRKQRSRIYTWIISGALAVILIGASVAGFFIFRNGEPSIDIPDLIADSQQILPANAMMYLKYQFDAPQALSQIQQAWQSDQQSTVADLLNGDPRLLLPDSTITEAFYVVLPSEPRPYLVVPKTELTAQLLLSTPDASVFEQEGWIIAHARSTNSYQTALTTGTLAGIGGHELLQPDTPKAHTTIILSSTFVQQLREELAGDEFVVAQLQELALRGQFESQGAFLRLTGKGEYQTAPSDEITDQQILSLVPADAEAVRLGANFASDITQWRTVSGILDDTEIDRPIVAQLVNDLDQPYAYYNRTGNDGSEDVGLIIKIPEARKGTLALGDAAIEQGLPAILPLILDRPTVAPIGFSDGVYAEIPLRFANVVQSSLRALDYALTDDYILIGTSKEGMFALLDTVAGNLDSYSAASQNQTLFSAWGAIPQSRDIVIGEITDPVFTGLLPTGATNSSVTIAASFLRDFEDTRVEGVLLLSPNAIISTLSTPTPSPQTGILIGSPLSTASPSPTTQPIETAIPVENLEPAF